MPWRSIETVSGLLIAVTALYVIVKALNGRWLEYQATRPDRQKEKETLVAKARTRYLRASLSSLPVLLVLATGVSLQIAVGLRKLFCDTC